MEQRHVKLGETLLGDIIVPVFVFGSNIAHTGKIMVIVSGVHGNEVSSVAGHIAFVRELERHSYADGFNGIIVSIPYANPLGLFGKTREFREGEDLNRSFKDMLDNMTCAELAAHNLKTEILARAPDLVIDVHTMSSRSLPMIIIDRVKYSKVEEKIVEYADMAGLPMVYDLSPTQYAKENLDASLSGHMANSGIPAFTIEVPGGPYTQWEASELVRKALWNIAVRTGIVTKITARVQGDNYTVGTWMYDAKLRFNFKGERRFARATGPRAKHAGLFLVNAFPGIHYNAGKEIGTIVDISCQEVEKIKMPLDGYVSDIIDASIVAPGDELFELLTEEKR